MDCIANGVLQSSLIPVPCPQILIFRMSTLNPTKQRLSFLAAQPQRNARDNSMSSRDFLNWSSSPAKTQFQRITHYVAFSFQFPARMSRLHKTNTSSFPRTLSIPPTNQSIYASRFLTTISNQSNYSPYQDRNDGDERHRMKSMIKLIMAGWCVGYSMAGVVGMEEMMMDRNLEIRFPGYLAAKAMLPQIQARAEVNKRAADIPVRLSIKNYPLPRTLF